MNSYEYKNPGSELSLYERWQIAFSVIQIFIALIQATILIVTVYVAWNIGRVQNNINQQILDTNFRISLISTFEGETLNIYNQGKDNVYIWGIQLSDQDKMMLPEGQGRQITPGAIFHIPLTNIKDKISREIGKGGEVTAVLKLFVSAENGKKYIVNVLYFTTTTEGNVNLNSQTLNYVESDWSK